MAPGSPIAEREPDFAHYRRIVLPVSTALTTDRRDAFAVAAPSTLSVTLAELAAPACYPSAMDRNTRSQLALLRELTQLLGRARIRFWLRGGWALDFHAGQITRDHGDIDLVARFLQRSRILKLLEENGYRAVRFADLASIHFSKRGQDVAIAFIWTDEMARTVTPGREFWPWPDDAFGNRRHALHGISCRVMSVESLLEEKANFERYSGRPLREKDLVSIELLRSLQSSRR